MTNKKKVTTKSFEMKYELLPSDIYERITRVFKKKGKK